MKFNCECSDKNLIIPRTALQLSGFGQREEVEYHALEDAIVILKKQMTAKELACAAYQLQELSTKLFVHLAEACGTCSQCMDSCPARDLGDHPIELPEDVLVAAGIPKSAKLCVSVDKEDGIVLISEADNTNELQDLPKELVEELAAIGVCMDELESLLSAGDIVYGM